MTAVSGEFTNRREKGISSRRRKDVLRYRPVPSLNSLARRAFRPVAPGPPRPDFFHRIRLPPLMPTMGFSFHPLQIRDVILIRPERHLDDRGYFMEVYREEVFAAAGIDAHFVQDNLTRSVRGALRARRI